MDNVNTENMSNKEMIEELMRLRAEMNEVRQKLASQENSIKTINSFLAAMTEAQDFGRTMQEVESVTKQLTNCDSAAFYCYDSAENKFFTADNDSRNWQDAEFTEVFAPIMNDKNIKIENNSAIIPISSSKGDVIGVISAEKENGFDNVDFTPFAAGSEIVNTIDLAVRKELNHQTAVTDELTGLKNRDGLNEYINKTLLSNIQEEKPVNILMCDIDHFKSVNDTYGHDAGDIILQGVAKILQENTRSGSDCTFRMGGEEMVCIFNCDAAKAYEVAERIRKEIESTVHKVKSDGVEHEVKVTISMGLVQMKPEQEMTMFNARQVFDAEFKKADIAVYNAKESGRNQVVASSEIFESYASQKLSSYILQNSDFAPAEYNSAVEEIEKMVKISDKETLNQLITEKASESFEYKSEFKEMTELINKAAEQNDRPVIICIQQNSSIMHRKVDISVNEIKKMLVESDKPYAAFAILGKGINEVRYAEIEQSGKSISIDINMDENTWRIRADDEFVKECSIDSLVMPKMLESDKENFLNECQNAEQWADDAIMTEKEFGEYLNNNRPNYR